MWLVYLMFQNFGWRCVNILMVLGYIWIDEMECNRMVWNVVTKYFIIWIFFKNHEWNLMVSIQSHSIVFSSLCSLSYLKGMEWNHLLIKLYNFLITILSLYILIHSSTLALFKLRQIKQDEWANQKKNSRWMSSTSVY